MPTKFEKPQDHWLPFWRAFLALDNVNRIMLTKELEGISAHIRRRGNVYRYGEFVDLEINFETGKWGLKCQEAPDGEQHTWEYPLLDLEEDDGLTFAIDDDETIKFIRDWKADARSRGKKFLKKVIAQKRRLYARQLSPTSPLTLIPHDSLASFKVEDVHTGKLVCNETGERLFAAFIDPSPIAAFNADASSTNDAYRGLYEQDIPYLAEMKKLITNKKISVWAAAGQLAKDAPGHGTVDSKQSRLARRYSKHFDGSDS
jgi:hypothetical protein